MDFLLDFILHIDQYMVMIVRDYHAWTYAILFFIIFCETGLVVTPFLPGDSLLFVAGAISALPDMPGKQDYNNDNGVLNPFSFRHLSPLKILRFNIPSVTIRILSSLKIQLPQNQWTGFSYYTNLFKYSDRYHIYSLGHILI